jgi:hypothetical protein
VHQLIPSLFKIKRKEYNKTNKYETKDREVPWEEREMQKQIKTGESNSRNEERQK